MCSRISSAGLALVVAACGAASPAPEGDHVDCAIGGVADLAPVCTLERAGEAIVIHHPDGSFRRFARAADGALTPSDGAEALVPAGDTFAVGRDRYRIPPALIASPVP